MAATGIYPERARHRRPPGRGAVRSERYRDPAAVSSRRADPRSGRRRESRPGVWAMLFGLVGTAAAWFLQTEFGETLTAQVCYRHEMASSLPRWLMPSIHAITVLALVIGLTGVAVAAWNCRHTRTVPSSPRHVLDTRPGRQHFLATAGLLFSLLFLFGLVAAGLAVWLVSPCGPWR